MKKLFTLLALIAFLLPAKAQYLNFYMNGSCPMDELKDSNYHDGLGFSVEYLSPSIIKTKNNWLEWRIGAGVEYLRYGKSKKIEDIVFDTPNSDLGSVAIKNQMTGLYLASKFVFNTGRISPYIDVFAASRDFSTFQVNRFNKEVSGYERETSKLLLKNGRGHYGASVGLLYKLNSSVMFDARVSYSTGTGIKFLDVKSLVRDPAYESNISYHKVQALSSNLLIFRIGVMLRLKRCENCPSSSSPRTPTTSPVVRPTKPPTKPAEVKPVPKPTPPPKPVDY